MMTDKDLNLIVGGAVSGSLVKNVLDAYEFILNLGRQIGSAIRRKMTNNYC